MPRDARVTLGPVLERDLPSLWEWINDDELVRLSGPYRPVSEAQHRAWFARLQERTDVHLFAIRLQPTSELIGTRQLHSIHPVHRTAELQVRIGPPNQRGKGYGTEALRLLLRFAFHDLNLERVSLNVLDSNTHTLRSYQKVGFVQEGVLRKAAFIDGQRCDLVVMDILPGEFHD